MQYRPHIRPAVVTGPEGAPLTLLGLPPRDTTRWTARRKAEIVAAVTGGLMAAEEACEWYDLSPEELDEWRRASDGGGMPALRATCSRQPRRKVLAAAAA